MADIEKKQEMNGRRRFLIAATSIAGGIAGVAVATPFMMSMMPSERAKAAGAPVEVDISKVEPGMLLMVEWRGKVVWILNRTPEMLANLKKLDSVVADPKSEKDQQPKYAQNETRSIKPAILVAEGVCTHLGCSPIYRKDIAPWAVFSAPVTAPSSISRAASTKASLRPPTLSSPPTCI